MNYIVKVINDATGEVVKEIDAGESMRRAEKIERGLQVNLNHEEYSTAIAAREAAP